MPRINRWTDRHGQTDIIVVFRADDKSYCESSVVRMWFKK